MPVSPSSLDEALDIEHLIETNCGTAAFCFQQLLCRQKLHLSLEGYVPPCVKVARACCKAAYRDIRGLTYAKRVHAGLESGQGGPHHNYIWIVIDHVMPRFGKNGIQEAKRVRARLVQTRRRRSARRSIFFLRSVWSCSTTTSCTGHGRS